MQFMVFYSSTKSLKANLQPGADSAFISIIPEKIVMIQDAFK